MARMLGRPIPALLATLMFLSWESAEAANDAQVAGSTIPTTMTPGVQYAVSVTMRNTGSTTWTRAGQYKLGAVGDSDPFAPGRVELRDSDAIGPGQQRQFDIVMTAPIQPGVYTTDWRMVQEHVEWFGQTVTRQVQVTFGAEVPGPPTITWPPVGSWVGSNRPDITWAGVPHDAYEVHIGSQNDPSAVDGWDSGVVWVSELTTSAMSGPLVSGRWYYAFARLHNANGWGPWSAPGRSFYVAGELMNEPAYVAGPVGAQWPHSICHNPDRSEYLIAFADAEPGQQSRISYCRLDATGARIGDEVTITDDDHLDGVHEAGVAYSSIDQEYFIAYTGWMQEGSPHLHDQLRGLRVDAATGAMIGGSYVLYDSPDGSAIFEHKVCSSPVSNVHLVVWHESSNDGEILAMRVSAATGLRVGGLVHLTQDETRLCANPSVAWNSAQDEFLVVFQVDASCDRNACNQDPRCDCLTSPWCIEHGCVDNGWDYYGQRIRASDGELPGGNVPLATSAAWDSNGGIAYDSDLNRYLMVYEAHDGGAAIWGRFLAADGTPWGSRFPVLSAPRSGGAVNVGWHPGTREYLAAWLDCCTPNDYARRLSQMGALLGEPFKINGTVTGIGNWKPLPVPNVLNDEFLLAWFCSYNDVYVRRYRACPVPDTTPPGPVTSLTGAPCIRQITLSWMNPQDPDFLGTLIRYKTTGFPAGPHDGTALVVKPGPPGSADSHVHTGLDRSTTYYYALFACDGAANHASAVLLSARPSAPADFDCDGDVDQEDFGRFQVCLSGSGQAYPVGCDTRDFDLDGDVDQDDFGQFRACMGGADAPPACGGT